MPFQSHAQAGAMFAANAGNSTLGIPKNVGAEFVAASPGQPVSPLPEHVQAQQGFKAKSRTHRGRQSRGKAAKHVDHHAQAKEHMAAAQAAPSPQDAHAHLFRALTSLNKAKAVRPTTV